MNESIDMARLVVRLDADITRLEAGLSRAVRKSQQTAHEIERSGMGEAIANIMTSSRARIMEEGAASLGVLGSGLEAIGPAGLAAAAGVGVMAAAVEQAMRTAEWAESLLDTADALHLTAEQMQAVDFAATAAGVPLDQMRTSMQALNIAMGQAQAGGRMGRRMQEVFTALGVDPATISRMHDVTDLLPLLADGLHRLSESAPAEASALGSRLGLTPEVLSMMEQGRARIEDLITAAHRYGLVIDEDMIRKGSEAADQMRETSAIIDAELRAAFINLAPAITDVATAIAHVAENIGGIVQSSADAIRGLHGIANALSGLRLPSWLMPAPGVGGRVGFALNTAATGFIPGYALLSGAAQYGQAQSAADRAADLHNGVMDLMANGLHPQTHTTDILNHTAGAGSSRRRAGGRSGGTARIVALPYANGIGAQSADRSALVDASPDRLRDITIDTSGLRDVAGEIQRGLDERHEQLVQQWQGVIQGGLEAAIHGGWRGLAQYMAQQLEQALVNSLASTLANMFAPNSVGSGGIGSFIAAIFAGSPRFASGGITPGGPVWVGEYGKELVNLPRGSQVLSHATSMGGMPTRQGTVVNQTINLNADGAVLAGELVQHLQSFSVQAASAAFNGARVTIPNDLQRRAMRRLA